MFVTEYRLLKHIDVFLNSSLTTEMNLTGFTNPVISLSSDSTKKDESLFDSTQEDVHDLRIEYVIYDKDFVNFNLSEKFKRVLENAKFKHINQFDGEYRDDRVCAYYDDNKGVDIRLVIVELVTSNFDINNIEFIDYYKSKGYSCIIVFICSNYAHIEEVTNEIKPVVNRSDYIVVGSFLTKLGQLLSDKISEVRGRKIKTNDAGNQYSQNSSVASEVPKKEVVDSALANLGVKGDICILKLKYIDGIYRRLMKTSDESRKKELNAAIEVIRRYKRSIL
jgi:hypothetical protein